MQICFLYGVFQHIQDRSSEEVELYKKIGLGPSILSWCNGTAGTLSVLVVKADLFFGQHQQRTNFACISQLSRMIYCMWWNTYIIIQSPVDGVYTRILGMTLDVTWAVHKKGAILQDQGLQNRLQKTCIEPNGLECYRKEF